MLGKLAIFSVSIYCTFYITIIQPETFAIFRSIVLANTLSFPHPSLPQCHHTLLPINHNHGNDRF